MAANTSIKAMPEGARAVHYGGPGASEDGDVSDGDRGGIDCRCRNSSPALRLPSFPSLEAATAAGTPTLPETPKPGGPRAPYSPEIDTAIVERSGDEA